jgi:xanthine dehydrogenase small subunit
MKTRITFICNREEVNVEVHPGLSLLDFLRKHLFLTGTKEACREGDCGACTVLIGELQNNEVKYHSVNSCLFPIGDVSSKHVVTVEGLYENELNVVQKSFVDEGASQCGFCTPGFIVSLTGYFLSNNSYNSEDATLSMDGNICRCTGHASIIRAAQKSFNNLSSGISNHTDRITALIKAELIPEYFREIPKRLAQIKKDISSKPEEFKPKFFVSGGTDLFVQQWENILKSDVELSSAQKISSNIKAKKGKCIIGAKATVSDFINSEVILKYFPSLKEDLKLFGSLPIRNRATLGGNIVNASPIGDMTNILIALDSTLKLGRENKFRELKLRDFYRGYKLLDLQQGELLEEISFDLPSTKSKFNFEKVSQRTYLDIASANSSIHIESDNGKISKCSISAGGVAPIPLYLKQASEYLSGTEINFNNISEATDIALTEISPITDARGSAEYKSLLLRQLIFAHFIKLFPEKISIKEIA